MLLGLLLVVLLLGIAAFFFLQSEAFDRWIRTKVVETLEDRFAVRVELESVDFRLMGTQVQVEGLKIFNLTYPSPEPVIDIDSILVDFSITHYISPAASLDSLVLGSPRIRLLEDPNARLNLSNMFFSQGEEKTTGDFSLTDLGIDRITIDDGLLLYRNQPLQFDTAEGGMSAQVRFIPESEKYEGEVGLAGLDLEVAGFTLTGMDTSFTFEYFSNQLLIPSLLLDSNEVDGQVSGAIQDLKTMTYEFDSDLTVDLPLLKTPDLSQTIQRGLVHLEGTFAGQGGDFAYTGDASSPVVVVEGLPLRELRTQVRVDRESALIQSLRAYLFGGLTRANGELSFQDTAASRFEVTASQVQIHPVLQVFNQGDLGVFGAASYTGNVSFPGLEFSQIGGRGQVTYRGRLSPQGRIVQIGQGVPFAGNAAVRLRGESVYLSSGLIDTPQSDIRYEGFVTFNARYNFDVDVFSEQGNELLQLARSLGIDPEFLQNYRLDLRGPTQIAGTVANPQRQFAFSGAVQSQQIVLNNQLLGNFQSQIQYAGNQLQLENANLIGPDFNVRTSLRFTLGDQPSREPAMLDLQINQVPVERMLAILGRDLPIRGQISGEIQMREVALGQYAGGGQITIVDPRAYGEELRLLTTSIEFEGSRLLARDIEAQLGQGTISGQIAYDLEDKNFQARLQGSDIPLESIEAVQQRAAVQGLFDVSVQASGTVQDPDFQVRLEAPQVQIREYTLQDVRLVASGENKLAEFEFSNSFQGNPFLVEGQVRLEEPYPIQAEVDLQNVPVAPYVALIPAENFPEIGGELSGQLTLSGPLQNPEALTGDAVFSELGLSMRGYEIRNADTVRVSYIGGVLEINPLTFTGQDTELHVSGTVKLAEPRTINLRIDGTANLQIANSFMESGATGGELVLERLIVSGPLGDPQAVGQATIQGAFLVHPDAPTPVFDVHGNFQFTSSQISIEDLSASTKFGTVSAEGGVFMEGLEPTRWRFNVFGSGLRVEYPDEVWSTLDVDIDLFKSERGQLISGAVYVRSAEYTENVTIPELLLRYSSRQVDVPSGEAQEEEVVLDISVEAYQTLRINNNVADLIASGNFDIRGTLNEPVILGSMTIEEGTLFFENNQYEVTRGTINFNNPRQTTPVFNFEASTDVREFTVTIAVRGSVEQLNVSFRSDPPMPTASIVSLLAIGQTQEEIFGTGTGAQREAGALALFGAGTLLSRTIGEEITGRTSRLFGFDTFSIDPFLQAGERDPGARITLGKNLTKDFSLTYSTNLGDVEQGQIVIIEYRIFDWLTAVGTRDQDGEVAIDFKLRRRF